MHAVLYMYMCNSMFSVYKSLSQLAGFGPSLKFPVLLPFCTKDLQHIKYTAKKLMVTLVRLVYLPQLLCCLSASGTK